MQERYSLAHHLFFSEGGVLSSHDMRGGEGGGPDVELPTILEKCKMAGVRKKKDQPQSEIPCFKEGDNGEWGAALALINNEHKAWRYIFSAHQWVW